jgi:rhodanese-related sulfurtransferase
MRSKIMISVVCLLLSLLTFPVFAGGVIQEFPGRSEYPDVRVIDMEELNNRLTEVVLVDTRSHYEFETLRMNGAVNLPVADKNFEQEVKKLAASSAKDIVFYCNGRSCYKSYIAVKKARAVDVNNTLAFDAGVFEWTMRHPAQSSLLGKSPVDTKLLISKDKLASHTLDPETFNDKVFQQDKASMVIDIRDKYQRAGVGFYPGKERWASLDNKAALDRYIEKAKKENKTLFIYDEVGQQVPWLQYALENAGVSNYYFMAHGAKGYYSMIGHSH